jgi:AcrR family transcriptional regulator
MTTHECLRLADLVERSGVPAATIRHYVRLGLLAQPRRTASRRPLYNASHLESLLLVRALRERRNLPLDVIRTLLPELTQDLHQPFRPEAWEQAVELHLGRSRVAGPADKLLEVAITAFDARAYAEVTVDDLCTAAGLAKGSFYRYYPSKEDLFFAVVEAVGLRAVESLEEAHSIGYLDRSRAAGVVADSLGPHLPVILELFARMAQRRPGYPRVGRQLVSDMAAAVSRLLGVVDSGDGPSGLEVLGAGLAQALRGTLDSELVTSVSQVGRPSG